MNTYNSKSGLVRSFIVIVFGILFLSFIGFDLRGQVANFQEENEESITYVKQVLLETVIPKTKDSLDDIQAFAEENDITVERAQEVLELLKKYKDEINLEEYGIEVSDLMEKIEE